VTVINTKELPLSAALVHCIPCEDYVNDTSFDTARLSSTYTVCGDATTIQTTNEKIGNAHNANINFISLKDYRCIMHIT